VGEHGEGGALDGGCELGVRYDGWLGDSGGGVLSGGAGSVGCCCYCYCWLGLLGCMWGLEVAVVVLYGREVVGVRGVAGTWEGSGDG
jgi:hypothetical protein